MDESQIEALKNHEGQIVPLDYMAQPESIASSALFLASADASYVNGVEMMVDGGFSQI
jgi:NAD(P)-dependent dehydrogenase (short-subunit alcohol dehydrogenase family)